MTEPNQKTSADLPDSDAFSFDEVQRAVMATERGRWFLAEFARRNRSADTLRVLAAIERLEARIAPVAIVPQALPIQPKKAEPASPIVEPASIEALMQRLGAAIANADVAPRAETPDHTPSAQADAFSDIDAMTPEERLRLFY